MANDRTFHNVPDDAGTNEEPDFLEGLEDIPTIDDGFDALEDDNTPEEPDPESYTDDGPTGPFNDEFDMDDFLESNPFKRRQFGGEAGINPLELLLNAMSGPRDIVDEIESQIDEIIVSMYGPEELRRINKEGLRGAILEQPSLAQHLQTMVRHGLLELLAEEPTLLDDAIKAQQEAERADKERLNALPLEEKARMLLDNPFGRATIASKVNAGETTCNCGKPDCPVGAAMDLYRQEMLMQVADTDRIQ